MNPSRQNLHRLLAALSLSGLLVLACADTDTPRVEAARGDGWEALPGVALRIAGKREGARTDAVATFTLGDGRQLGVELGVVYNPTPSLGSGRWRMGAETGDVVAESLKFLGGQGEGPSLGGRFRLESNGVPRYRVTIPLQTLH